MLALSFSSFPYSYCSSLFSWNCSSFCRVRLPRASLQLHVDMRLRWQLQLSQAGALLSLESSCVPVPLLGFKPPCWGAVLKSHQVSSAIHRIQRVELIPHLSFRRRRTTRRGAKPGLARKGKVLNMLKNPDALRPGMCLSHSWSASAWLVVDFFPAFPLPQRDSYIHYARTLFKFFNDKKMNLYWLWIYKILIYRDVNLLAERHRYACC